MATYKVRGTAHNIIYPYRTESGQVKQQWETYTTALEAKQRKAYIDYLQENRMRTDIYRAAMEYRRQRAVEKAVSEQFQRPTPLVELPKGTNDDNMEKPIENSLRNGFLFMREKNASRPIHLTATVAI